MSFRQRPTKNHSKDPVASSGSQLGSHRKSSSKSGPNVKLVATLVFLVVFFWAAYYTLISDAFDIASQLPLETDGTTPEPEKPLAPVITGEEASAPAGATQKLLRGRNSVGSEDTGKKAEARETMIQDAAEDLARAEARRRERAERAAAEHAESAALARAALARRRAIRESKPRPPLGETELKYLEETGRD